MNRSGTPAPPLSRPPGPGKRHVGRSVSEVTFARSIIYWHACGGARSFKSMLTADCQAACHSALPTVCLSRCGHRPNAVGGWRWQRRVGANAEQAACSQCSSFDDCILSPCSAWKGSATLRKHARRKRRESRATHAERLAAVTGGCVGLPRSPGHSERKQVCV
jgi:hypothetical protein